MDIKKILVIFLLIIIYSILFWPTLNIYTHTVENVLVKINRITGEAYYFLPGSNWKKISYSGFKPLENDGTTKKYGSVELLEHE
ncbi:MAG TPA: hypothetical protein VMZ91_03795 [Candidatus Paceibacterota bacterium]|nr:hypothetical protein [Candidatus Paceibacterota bacterium]